MSDIEFLKNYFGELNKLINNSDYYNDLVKVKDILKKTHSSGKKTMIFGNGGSAAIASHFSVDLTKNARVRCTNYNESDLLTCFSNDYGYERWVEKAIDFYGDEGDSLILISAGGNSPNMINGANQARKKNINSIITFTGNDSDNKLQNLGDINFWVNSKAYNHIENVHQILLLSLVDLIIGKSEYPPN
ncbi:MAG: phosphoheptose isomerase [Candidatus Marinimicrobia bacterium]|nr:phosphoheptose isomerase [Candidatus Neomarinimicrobiota bacterium]